MYPRARRALGTKNLCKKDCVIELNSMNKLHNITLGLTYDDVLLVPHYSDTASRKQIDLTTYFSRRLKINIPIVSANMDTVTESGMATAVALAGGIGVIHRFMTIEEEAHEVRKVKRAQNFMITDPVCVSPDTSLAEAIKLMKQHGIHGLLVCNADKRLQGILTSRDIKFKTSFSGPVREFMTPRGKLITTTANVTQEAAVKIFDEYKVEKLPVINAEDLIVGLITASDFRKHAENSNASHDKNGRLLVAAAVGVKDGLERSEALVKAGADALVIDIAHGHSEKCVQLTRELKTAWPDIDVVAGNVATVTGALDLIKAGADAIKVGVGPGAACSTRIVAGSGVPQLTAVCNIADICRQYGVPLIADGGIKTSGDLAKAIGAGADTVMIGNLFSGTLESPGEYYIEDGQAVKVYRGLASREASIDRQTIEQNVARQDRAPEGVSYKVSYKGGVTKVLGLLVDGLQSGMSYTGAKNIPEFWEKAEFVRITEAGMRESAPRSHQT